MTYFDSFQKPKDNLSFKKSNQTCPEIRVFCHDSCNICFEVLELKN